MTDNWSQMTVSQYEWCRGEILRLGLAEEGTVMVQYPELTTRDTQLLRQARALRQDEMYERLSALYPVVFQNGEATIWKVTVAK